MLVSPVIVYACETYRNRKIIGNWLGPPSFINFIKIIKTKVTKYYLLLIKVY